LRVPPNKAIIYGSQSEFTNEGVCLCLLGNKRTAGDHKFGKRLRTYLSDGSLKRRLIRDEPLAVENRWKE